MKIIAFSGSLRKTSFNTMLLHNVKILAPAEMEIDIVSIGDFPLYSSDDESSFPPVVQAVKDKIEAADGIFIATPEYNRSLPGVLKNAIDWISRPYGKNSFARKSVLVAGVSSGKIGTAVAQSHLREILVYLDADVIGQPELYLGPAQSVFDEDGTITDETIKTILAKGLEALRARIHTHNA